MDFTTIGGIVVAIAMILVGQALEGGHVGSLLQLTAFLIVGGGTFGATVVSLPRSDLRHFKAAIKAGFTDVRVDHAALVGQLVEYATVARRDGVLALEQYLNDLEDPFLKRGLSFVVDGIDANVVRDALETETDTEFGERSVGAKIFETAGGFAPTIGIIGAVLGLIHVMQNLSDPSAIGPGIAVAFVATVYGVGLANIVFLPLGGKIKRKAIMERDRKALVTEGLLAIQAGLNPRVLEDKLRAFAGLPQPDPNANG